MAWDVFAADKTPVAGQGAGLRSNVSLEDLLRYIPGYNPAGQQPVDFTQLFELANRNPLADIQAQQGHQGNVNQRVGNGGGSPASQLLNQYFSGGAPQFDPNLMAQIQGLQQQQVGQYGALPGQIGGADDPIMRLILGELGPGGSANASSFNFGGGGGGGGAVALPSVDIGFHDLSPEMQARFDRQVAANVGALNLSNRQATGQSLVSLFGRGVPRSSIALDQQGRLQYGHEQALQQARAAGDQQALAAIMADAANRTQLGQSQISAAAQMAAANSAAGASSYAASLGAQSDLARARLGLLGDVFGARAGALGSAFGDQSRANLGFAGTLGDIGLGQLTAESNRANIAQNLIDSQNQLRASLAATQGGITQARIGQQTALANLPFENYLAAQQLQSGYQQTEAQRQQDSILKLLGIDLDRYLGQIGTAGQIESARLGAPKKPSTTDRLLGLLGAGAGMFSFGFGH